MNFDKEWLQLVHDTKKLIARVRSDRTLDRVPLSHRDTVKVAFETAVNSFALALSDNRYPDHYAKDIAELAKLALELVEEAERAAVPEAS